MATWNGKPKPADVRASVINDYLAYPRRSVRRIARDHDVHQETARRWIERAGVYRTGTERGTPHARHGQNIGDEPSAEEIGRLVYRSVKATLEAITARAIATSDPEWIKGQNAADLAQLEHAQREYVLRAIASFRVDDGPGDDGARILDAAPADRNGAVDSAG